jgi:hypothetical protein
LRKQIAGALVASLLIGSAPGWAAGEKATATVKSTVDEQAQRQRFRDSIDRAVDRLMAGTLSSDTDGVGLNEQGASGLELTAQERRDLDRRRAALRTDPVARGSGSVVLFLLGTAVSIGATIYLVHALKKDNTTAVSMARR